MLYTVTLRAEGMQVTAVGESAAERNAKEDAAQFVGDWTYVVDDVALAEEGEVPTVGLHDLDIGVECTEEADDEEDEDLWAFDVTFDVVVEGTDEETAKALAIVLPRKLRYGVDAPMAAPSAP